MAIATRQAVSKLIKVFKFLIFFGALFVLYQKLADTWNDQSLLSAFSTIFSPHAIPVMCFLLVLSFINWSLESVKWQKLLEKLEPFSFGRSLKSVLAGSSVTFINPYRSGAFLGRVLFLKENHRVEAAALSVLGGFAQTLATLVFGIISILFIGNQSILSENIDFLLILGCISLVILVILYFKLSLFQSLLKKWTFTHKVWMANNRIDHHARWNVLMWSFLRYCVFTLQFTVLLIYLNPGQSVLLIFGLVSIIFFILAIIPSFWFGNIGIRESISVSVLISYMPHEALIIVASLIIWLVNLVIPAILGSLFLFSQNNR